MSDPFTTEALVEWLRGQPGDTTYRYTDAGNCLLCRYLKSIGHKQVGVGPFSWDDYVSDRNHPLPERWNEISRGTSLADSWIYSAALALAEALLKQERGE